MSDDRWLARTLERHFPHYLDEGYGSRRTIETIAGRHSAGDPVRMLARDYDRPRSAIHAAIAFVHINKGRRR